MYGIYTLSDVPCKAHYLTSLDIYLGGAEYHPRRKKLKGYQKKCK